MWTRKINYIKIQKWYPSLEEKMNFRKRTPSICEVGRDKEKGWKGRK